MKKKILVISYYFAPQNTIGAIRPTKMVKYLERQGYDVTVLCGAGMDASVDPTLARDLQQMKDVRILREWNPVRRMKERRQAQSGPAAGRTPAADGAVSGGFLQLLKKKAAKLADSVYLYLCWLSDRHFLHLAKREIRKLNGTYDVVFSSYSSMAVHEAARYAQKRGKARKWIADFRDEVNMNFRWQEPRRVRYLEMVKKNADIISAVSEGFLDMMDLTGTGRVLSNGFDWEDLPAAQPAADNGKIRVVYCGFLSEGRKKVANRDITPMMRSLRRLMDEGLLTKDELQLVYAGKESHLFMEAAQTCGLEALVEDHGLVSREESIRLQQGADVLLMASWHMASQRGILTGKLFEYMMMNRPIVCCMAGDLTGSGVRKVLEETGIGFCCEAAAGKADEEQLYQYIKKLLERYRAGEALLTGSQTEAIEAYAYPCLARTLAGWVEE